MASYPADFYVPVQSFSDPTEVRPKDEQAIVLPICRDTPNKIYVQKINEHIRDPKSFLYVYRISGERLCVVLKEASQAAMLVEQIQSITVDDVEVPMKFFIAKSVKVIISNAGYGITNSALKRFLTHLRKIRTASSVSELKANVVPEDEEFDARSSRRVVYIHPEDVDKLPKGPVRFYTGSHYSHVFFEVDSPKCFLCSEPGHFRNSCPKNKENLETSNEEAQTQVTPAVGKVDPLLNQDSRITPALTPDDDKTDCNDSLELPPGGLNDVNSETADSSFDDVSSASQEDVLMGLDGNPLFTKPASLRDNKKRAYPPSSSTSSVNENTPSLVPTLGGKTINKKMKKCNIKSNPEVIKTQVKFAEKFILKEISSTFPVTYDQLINILASTIDKGYKKTADEAKESMPNIESLVVMLGEVYLHVNEQAVKTRITKFTNALKGDITTDSANESDTNA